MFGEGVPDLVTGKTEASLKIRISHYFAWGCFSKIQCGVGIDIRYDGVLVYFGYPQAHEDDAERAVRAGLESGGCAGQDSPPW